ncbi:MAG: prephenate dehydratase [Fibrobacteria bacterium]|nr:prephenate dehydratase [Fibrobacteria bacterium]
MKVAFQGEPGAYSEVAARHLFGPKCQVMPLPQFETVFKAVKNGKAQRAVIPIENSLAGSIHQNYDLLQQTGLNIISETHLRIEHVLMCGKTGSLKSIKEVLSHPQALSQCSDFINSKRSLSPIAFYDTAGAAKHIAQKSECSQAAIASIHAARLYKLKILKRNLENNHQNYTRFLGISRSAQSPKKGKLKTSISFAPAKNETGILFKMLGIFALRDVNLLKIESRPFPDRAFEYIFYLDLEGSPSDKPVKNALLHLQEIAAMVKVFGSYPIGKRTYIE